MTSPHPVRLVVDDDLKRSRLTVFFRLLLAMPHYVWATFWTLLMIFVSVVNWLATLITGRSPDVLHNLTAAYVSYLTQLFAYLLLAANPYPLFTGTERYPVDLEVDRARAATAARHALQAAARRSRARLRAGRSSRPTPAARTPRPEPRRDDYGAGATSSSVGILWTVAFFAWFACLALGRMPLGFRNLQAYGLRYCAQVVGATSSS